MPGAGMLTVQFFQLDDMLSFHVAFWGNVSVSSPENSYENTHSSITHGSSRREASQMPVTMGWVNTVWLCRILPVNGSKILSAAQSVDLKK